MHVIAGFLFLVGDKADYGRDLKIKRSQLLQRRMEIAWYKSKIPDYGKILVTNSMIDKWRSLDDGYEMRLN